MTDDRSLERAARSWLEAGPTEAPDRAIEAALLRIETTPQERDFRVPWRLRPMTQTTRLLTGAAAVVVILAGGIWLLRTGASPGVVGGPSAVPTATPAGTGPGTSLTETFTSTRHGFSVRYPTGWTPQPATRPWFQGDLNTWDSGINDALSSATARLSVASQPLASGQTPDAWIALYARGLGAAGVIAAEPSTWPAIDIGGLVGRLDADGGPANGGITPGGVLFDAIVIDGGRAYNFSMDGKVDRATFEAFLATVTLDPSAANDVPPLTETFTSARHGYQVRYPPTWTVSAATGPWPAGTEAAMPPASMLDVFTAGSDPARTFVVVSQPLAEGVTGDAWLGTYEASAAQTMPVECWPPPAQMETATVDGQPAWIHGGRSNCAFTEAIVFAGGRVYELTAYFPAGGTPTDRHLFDAVLATIQFDPSSADDTPSASSSPSASSTP